MAWTRLDIPCDADSADLIAALVLAETGRGASVLEQDASVIVQAWVPDEWAAEWGARLRQRLRSAGPPLDQTAAAITETLVPDDDWSLGWRRHFKAFRAGERLVVKPSWEPWPPEDDAAAARPDDLIIEIDPGGAFGTGTHASTQLALRALEEAVAPRAVVIDVGCGSGILSLGALLLGADRVVAIDFDPAAVQCTRRNLEEQHLADRAHVVVADGLSALRCRADVIVANITDTAVVAVGAQARYCLKPGGRYIVSGFLETSATAVRQGLEALGLTVARAEGLDGWSSLTLVQEKGGTA
ncbi:MAG: methyltransferase [Armatimonadetes bacterium]|nr:methyltransferase [Armatimonadota bacterium]